MNFQKTYGCASLTPGVPRPYFETTSSPFMHCFPSVLLFLFPFSLLCLLCVLAQYRQEYASIFILAHLSTVSFPLFPSLFLVLRPFVPPDKDATAESKHLCSVGLYKCTFIFVILSLHTNAVHLHKLHGFVLSHFNHVNSLSRAVSLCRWVQIACPRLSIDWGTAFSKPLLSPYEVHASYIHHLSLLNQREEISLNLPPGPRSPQQNSQKSYFCFSISQNSTFPRGKLNCVLILYA